MKNKLLFLGIIILSGLLGGYILKDYLANNSNNNIKNVSYTPIVNHIEDAHTISNKIIVEDTLIKKIKGNTEIITMEVDVSEEILYDDSYFGNDLFKKIQKINIYAIGVYTVDLTSFTKEDIYIDSDNNLVEITTKAPKLTYVNHNPEKTVYTDVEKGVLRFGDVKLGINEYTKLQIKAEEQIRNKLNSRELAQKADEMAETVLCEMFRTFLSITEYKDYEIKVILK